MLLRTLLSAYCQNKGVVSLDLCSIVSKVMLGYVRLGYGGLGVVMLVPT